jgi:RHS repeat-associated protein
VQQRSPAGVVEWSTVLGDVRGSVAVTVPRGSSQVTSSWWGPYGARRGSRVDTVGTRGYLGQAEDVGSGLTYLNNRYHDPALGAFISVDPLVGTTGQPYLYADGNPSTLSDPTGLDPGWAHDLDPCNDAGYYECKAGGSTKEDIYDQGPRQRDELARGIGKPGGKRAYFPGCWSEVCYGPRYPMVLPVERQMTHRYAFENSLGVFGPDGPRLVAELFFGNPNQTFPFGISGPLVLGNVVDLDDGFPGAAPVRVTYLDETGFGFESIEGHPEGAGNFITFQFMLNDWGQTVLFVDSWGPPEGSALDAPVVKQFNMEFVKNLWLEFSAGLGSVASQKLPSFPCCPGR